MAKKSVQSTTRNVFIDQPEFVESDPRKSRPDWLAYSVSPEFMFLRHEVMIPAEIIAGKTILDLGSCNAASGAWCLSNDAKHYTGVELQPEYIKQSKLNLEKYYPEKRWEIISSTAEDFLRSTNQKFDIVIALGIVHAFSNPIAFLKRIANMANIIVIDGTHPFSLIRSTYLSDEVKEKFINTEDYIRFIENEPFMGIHRTGMSLHKKSTVLYDGIVPSMGGIVQILLQNGMLPVAGVNEALKSRLPIVYSPKVKFGLRFQKENIGVGGGTFGLINNLSMKGKLPAVDWSKK